MCIVVDTNCFASVFNSTDTKHTQFKPVFDHINNGHSKMIIGGTRFKAEIDAMTKYASVLAEMRRAKKIVYEVDEDVDILEEKITTRITDPVFNDQHVVALTYTSNARLVCTRDGNLSGHIRAREFYNRGKTRANIFNESSRPATLPSGAFRRKCRLCRSATI